MRSTKQTHKFRTAGWFTQPVTIDIYNIKGQRIRQLVNGTYPAGNHTVIWNGTDDNVRNVGSGVFFYRMKTDDFTQTKRMLLLK